MLISVFVPPYKPQRRTRLLEVEALPDAVSAIYHASHRCVPCMAAGLLHACNRDRVHGC